MSESTVAYHPRSFWTDEEPGGHPLPHEQINGLTIHHTVMPFFGEPGDLVALRKYMVRLAHVRPDLAWRRPNGTLQPEVPYSFVVFKGNHENQGIVIEGRGWDRTGAHTANFNSKVYGVAYAGNTDIEHMTPGVVAAIRHIGMRLPRPLEADRTRAHRETKATSCPGSHLYAVMDKLQPPFIAPKETELPDTLEFAKRDNEDTRVYLIIGGKYKMWVPDMPTLYRWAVRHNIAHDIRRDTELVNGCETIGEEP